MRTSLGLGLILLSTAWAQKEAPVESGTIIRTETRLVLVDAVVTDKKGAYVHDLTAKDFKVWEDNKEQTVKSFSSESDPDSPTNGRPHYLVLFFDNSTLDFADQKRARDAAALFVDKNAGKDRYMAVVNFSGGLRIPENFTNDPARVQAAVKGVNFSSVASDANAPAARGQVSALEASFGARNMLLALKSLAKNLNNTPGRKILVLFTNGFPITPSQMVDVTAAIDACNKSNVAVYPIDVKGLVSGIPTASLEPPQFPSLGLLASSLPLLRGPLFAQVKAGGPTGGGGGAGGGGRPGGGPVSGGPVSGGGGSPTRGPVSPTRGPAPTPTPTPTPTNPNNGRNNIGGINNPNPVFNPTNNARQIIPQLPPSTETNQQLMLLLAEGTGGFVIRNTNDLLAGLTKIGQEQNEYYILGYTPAEDQAIGCHSLRVKVNHGGANVRARTGYCDAKPLDALGGNKTEKSLEAMAAANAEGAIHSTLRLPYFYTASNVARVNVAMEIAPNTFKFQKMKGKFHGEINIVGLAYTPEGTVAARFSDAVKIDVEDKKQVEQVQEKNLHYENQFEIAPGQYMLKVVFSADGTTYGKVERPLRVEPYQDGQFGISDLALSKEIRNSADVATGLDAVLLEDRVPLLTKGLQIIPTGDSTFEKSDRVFMYFEAYEPLVTNADPAKPFQVAMQMRILDKQGNALQDSGLMPLELPTGQASPVLPQGLRVPLDSLSAGSYVVEMKLVDSAGKGAARSTEIQVR